MARKEINKFVCSILNSYSEYNVNEDTDLIQDLQLDSITYIQMIISLENEFSIEITGEDVLMENMNSIEKISNTIERYIDVK